MSTTAAKKPTRRQATHASAGRYRRKDRSVEKHRLVVWVPRDVKDRHHKGSATAQSFPNPSPNVPDAPLRRSANQTKAMSTAQHQDAENSERVAEAGVHSLNPTLHIGCIVRSLRLCSCWRVLCAGGPVALPRAVMSQTRHRHSWKILSLPNSRR